MTGAGTDGAVPEELAFTWQSEPPSASTLSLRLNLRPSPRSDSMLLDNPTPGPGESGDARKFCRDYTVAVRGSRVTLGVERCLDPDTKQRIWKSPIEFDYRLSADKTTMTLSNLNQAAMEALNPPKYGSAYTRSS